MDKLRAFFDSPKTWFVIGTLAGLAGEKVAQGVGLIGQLVMTVL